MTSAITYEFPLNERIRVFIRLEQLFQHFSHFLSGPTEADKRAAVGILLDIALILRRNDLKSEILKELERHIKVLTRLADSGLDDSDGVDAAKLTDVLGKLVATSKNIYNTAGKVGNRVVENDLLQSIAQRSSIPGGTCCFDLPEYHYWLAQDESRKYQDLEYWSNSYNDVRSAIELILHFIRSSSMSTQETAVAGFYQIALDKNQPYQLIKVTVDKSLPCFAEISGGKHRCSIRFMTPGREDTRAAQSLDDIPFELTCCLF